MQDLHSITGNGRREGAPLPKRLFYQAFAAMSPGGGENDATGLAASPNTGKPADDHRQAVASIAA